MTSGESQSELSKVSNRQNDWVWANSSSEVPTVTTVKQPLKILVLDMMSYRGLSELQ